MTHWAHWDEESSMPSWWWCTWIPPGVHAGCLVDSMVMFSSTMWFWDLSSHPNWLILFHIKFRWEKVPPFYCLLHSSCSQFFHFFQSSFFKSMSEKRKKALWMFWKRSKKDPPSGTIKKRGHNILENTYIFSRFFVLSKNHIEQDASSIFCSFFTKKMTWKR